MKLLTKINKIPLFNKKKNIFKPLFFYFNGYFQQEV